MVKEIIFCWIVIHHGPARTYEKVEGYIMKQSSSFVTVNFYEAFNKKGIDLKQNNVVQWINENECTYPVYP